MKRILEYFFTKLVRKSIGTVTSICTDKDGSIYKTVYTVIFYSFLGYEWCGGNDVEKILAGNNQARLVFELHKNADSYKRGLEIILGDNLAHEELYRVLMDNGITKKEAINITLQWARNIASTSLTGKFQQFYNPNKLATVFTPYGCKQL